MGHRRRPSAYGELFRVTILLQLATLQTEAGDLMHARETIDEALVIAREISDVGSRASKLTEVAIAQAEAGDTKKAFAAAMVLTGYQRVQVLVHIASNTPD